MKNDTNKLIPLKRELAIWTGVIFVLLLIGVFVFAVAAAALVYDIQLSPPSHSGTNFFGRIPF